MNSHEDARLVSQGYRWSREVTRHHAKSFFFASYLLFGERRKAAFALYAFCRRLDDMVDEGGEGGAPEDLKSRLERARQRVAEVYLPMPELAAPGLESPAQRLMSAQAQSSWHEGEFAALKHCIHRFRIPEQPFQDLISGMEMDLTKHRYATFEELDLYCYRVAGVVGLMLTPVLGCTDERAVAHAADLGRGMQLTNILRDVREDLERGRVYLPSSELASFGLSEEDLRSGRVEDRWRSFMRFQISRARGYYASAAAGLPYLQGLGSRRMVRLMGGIYGDILRVIEARDYDVFSARAYVPGRRKLALALAAMVRPAAVMPLSSGGAQGPLLPTGIQG
ncbi:phytoene/squalene synthase family protein [Stigmatella sp. ncwal1]|uniref:Phytoene/squalene synthase family protein n=1 Tax=Stigmatella ashevillensis TaxID=2995309 RepID=A0ABT5DBK4_9BACT|nr:phytoene/squalene synthase family protein [Stigmatella ashevillena]MDC0710439.1 phytoene/squalene synthase family protein [Stigmatella ashevillena]